MRLVLVVGDEPGHDRMVRTKGWDADMDEYYNGTHSEAAGRRAQEKADWGREWVAGATPDQLDAFRLGYNFGLEMTRKHERDGWVLMEMLPSHAHPWSTDRAWECACDEDRVRELLADAEANMAASRPRSTAHDLASRRREVALRALREHHGMVPRSRTVSVIPEIPVVTIPAQDGRP